MNKLNRRALALVITGIVAAIAAGVAVWWLASTVVTTPPPKVVPTPVVQLREVVVANGDIAPYTVITASQVVTRLFSVDMVPADAITSTARAVNTAVQVQVFSGQVLLERQFVPVPPDGRGLTSQTIPAGKVLIAFPSTDMLNATGAVQAGDIVDIMITMPISGTSRLDSGATSETQLSPGQRAIVTQRTLQKIKVQSVGRWVPPGQQGTQQANADPNAAGLKIITFIVDPQEALILKFIKDSGGTIDLAVRSSVEGTPVPPTDPVTLDYLVDLYTFIGIPQLTPVPR